MSKRWPKRRTNAIVINKRVIHLRPLCRKYDLDPAYVSRILRGKQPVENIAVKNALIISRALNCTVEELMVLVEGRRLALSITSDAPPVLNTRVG